MRSALPRQPANYFAVETVGRTRFNPIGRVFSQGYKGSQVVDSYCRLTSFNRSMQWSKVSSLSLSKQMYYLCKLVPEMNSHEVKDTLHWLQVGYKGPWSGGVKKLYGRLKRREEELMGIPSRRPMGGPVRVYYQHPSSSAKNTGHP